MYFDVSYISVKSRQEQAQESDPTVLASVYTWFVSENIIDDDNIAPTIQE